MNYINQIILEQLHSDGKTALELKDALECSYSVLDAALRELIEQERIEPAWSNDDFLCEFINLNTNKGLLTSGEISKRR